MQDTIGNRNIRTLVRLKDMWESNIVANKPYIRHEVSELWNDFLEMQGCLVCAGPSLKANLPELADRARSSRKTEICAVDMAADYLLKNGIKMNYIITSEGKSDTSKILECNCDVPLICDVATNPEIVKNWKGEKYFFITNNPCIDLDNGNVTFSDRHKRLSGITTIMTAGGNVGSLGVSFMLSVRNVTKLYLYGHDFCWKDNAEFYCGGIQKELANKRIETEKSSGTLYDKTDINGDRVQTNMSLLTFLDWYQEVIKRYPDAIINRTGAGLLN